MRKKPNRGRRHGPVFLAVIAILSGLLWHASWASDGSTCSGSLAIRLQAAGVHLGPFGAGDNCVAGAPDAFGLIYWTHSPIRGQVGNGGLTVTLAEGGRLIGVLWPSPILYDQNGGAFGYETQPGAPEHGRSAASGVRYGIRADGRFVWLDDAQLVQRTRYADPRSLRLIQDIEIPELALKVAIESFIDPVNDVLVQNLRVTNSDNRKRQVALVHYENLTPTNLALPLTTSTISDTVIDPPNERVAVTADMIEHGALGVPVAFAWGSQPLATHRMAGVDSNGVSDGVTVMVNGQRLSTGTLPSALPDAYIAATQERWQPITQTIGPANAAQDWQLELTAGGSAEVAVYAAAASTQATANDALRRALNSPLPSMRAAVDAHWWEWTQRATRRPALSEELQPEGEALERLFWRSLLVLGMNLDRSTGLLSAGAFRQPPYGASWPRDTSVTAYILGQLGYREEARRALIGTAALQKPDGGFGGASYNNGAPWPFNEGLPLTYFGGQVDGTGWFVWSVGRYYALTADSALLRELWPSVRKAADFLTAWRDPGNGGHLASNEEDRFLPGQTIAGDVAVILGLRAAAAMATALGQAPDPRWTARADEIEASIIPNYWRPEPGYFAWLTNPVLGGEYRLTADPSFDPIMWDHSNLIWPGRLFAPPHAEAEKTARHMNHFWSLMWDGEPGGRLVTEPYNTGLGWFATSLSDLEDQGLLRDGRQRARIVMRWLARHAAPETQLIGEVTTLDRPYPQSYGAPHSWAHAFAIQGMLSAWPETRGAASGDDRTAGTAARAGGALSPLTLILLLPLAVIARRRTLFFQSATTGIPMLTRFLSTLSLASLLTTLSVLTGCGSSNLPGNGAGLPRAEARYFKQIIPSFDGTPIATTVFVPPLAEGERAPLILHSNGWGDTRTKQPTDLTYNPNNFYGDMHHGMVTRMWRAGYVVISLDNRGWGDSGGQARIMDPDKEIRDYSVVIDWAESNLPVTLEGGRAKVGAIGGSYGGGFQIPLAYRDTRIKAISPWVTWYDLRYSLAPDKVMRSGHVTLLNLAGLLLARVDPFIPRAYATTLATNTPPQDVLDTLKHHSPIEFCEQGAGPKVDALIVQGTRDTLFDGLEGWQNAECLRTQGADVRMIYVPNGHLFTQQGIQSNPTTSLCGPVDPFESVVSWYDEKLRGVQGAAARVPRLCLPVTDTQALFPEKMPIGGTRYEIPPTQIVYTPGNRDNSGAQFVPLTTLSRQQDLAGLPRLTVQITGTLPALDSIIFVGVGVQRAGGNFELLGDQLRPFRGTGSREELLPVIAARLQPGDVVGLALYTSHGQYFSSSSREPFVVSVSGSILLPMHD